MLTWGACDSLAAQHSTAARKGQEADVSAQSKSNYIFMLVRLCLPRSTARNRADTVSPPNHAESAAVHTVTAKCNPAPENTNARKIVFVLRHSHAPGLELVC